MRTERSRARRRRRTRTASRGKAALTQTVREPAIELPAEVFLVGVPVHHVLGDLGTTVRVPLVEPTPVPQYTMGEDNGRVLEHHEIDGVGTEYLSGAAQEVEPFPPARAQYCGLRAREAGSPRRSDACQ